MIREREVHVVPGGPVAILLPAIALGLLILIVRNVNNPWVAVSSAVGIAVIGVTLAGLFVVQPNQGKVLAP